MIILVEVLKDLENIVGSSDWASNRPEELWNYARDMTENPPGNPEFVVLPSTVDEIVEIVKLANKYKIPITPFVAGANVGGLAIPRKGGIIIDMKRMRNITVDEKNMIAVVEPGVSFGLLKKYLLDNHPDLTVSIPMAPPSVSVLVNAIMGGLGNLSHKHGSMSDMVSSLEVVLPTGEIIKTGSAATSPYWFGLHPLPNLGGIFINSQGTLGIVTKAGINLWPRPPVSANGILFAVNGPGDVYGTDFIYKLSRAEICDELAGGLFHFTLGNGLLPLDEMKDLIQSIVQIDNMEEKSFFLTWITIGANNDKELKQKWKVLEKLVSESNKKNKTNLLVVRTGDFGEIGKKIDRVLDLPMQLPPMYDLRQGGGLTWVGSYVPLNEWINGCNRGLKIIEKYGFVPGVLHRPMKGGHYAVMRFFLPFNKNDEGDIETVKKICDELVDVVLDVGGIPYKMPSWAASKVFKRSDPGFIALFNNLKKLLDPNGIMNPGRFTF